MRTSRTLLAAAGAAAGLLGRVTAQPSNACFFDSGVGATFDATPLTNTTVDYMWTDISDIYTINTTYYFNLCINTVAIPTLCAAKPVAPAYQVQSMFGACYALGYDLTARPTFLTKSLIDTQDPLGGWMVTYGNGDFCAATQSARTFSIMLRCGFSPFPPAGNNPLYANATGFIDESNTCSYSALSWSLSGCPLECPIVNGQLCGGNGVCGYDTDATQARCFCYNDWIESDCQTPRYTFPSGSVAGAVIGGILLGALIVLGYAFWAGRSASKASTQAVQGFYGELQ